MNLENRLRVHKDLSYFQVPPDIHLETDIHQDQ